MDADLIELARKAGSQADWTGHDAAPYETVTLNEDGLRILAALIAEECAKVCEDLSYRPDGSSPMACAAAIRAKFKAG